MFRVATAAPLARDRHDHAVLDRQRPAFRTTGLLHRRVLAGGAGIDGQDLGPGEHALDRREQLLATHAVRSSVGARQQLGDGNGRDGGIRLRPHPFHYPRTGCNTQWL